MSTSLSDGNVVNCDNFCPVVLGMLRDNSELAFDLFIQIKGTHEPFVLYREKSLPFLPSNRQRLREKGIETLYTRREQSDALRAYVEDNLHSIIEDDSVPVKTKAVVMYDSLVGLTQDVLHETEPDKIVPRSEKIVQNTCLFFENQRDVLKHIMGVVKIDYDTYSHSVNTFLYTMAIGQRLFTQESLTHEFGMGALLHDIGKSKISQELLNATRPLSTVEFNTMKKHTVIGEKLLAQNACVHPVTLDMVRHHHERVGGGGYPDNLSGSDVSLEARAITVADVFDALTTRRPYKNALDNKEALRVMVTEMQAHLDMNIFKILSELIMQEQLRKTPAAVGETRKAPRSAN